MTEALYERYKDALRRGHVAALRGRFEPALEAYTQAAEIATERALPWTSIGSVHLRMGNVADALAAYEAALTRSPRDEAALLGRAEALVRSNRRVQAAEALDLAAEVQQQAGRVPEALDTARRALELAESKARRRHVEGLARELRAASNLDMEAEQALARALQLLEPPTAAEALAVEPQPPEPVGTHADLARLADGEESPAATVGDIRLEGAGPAEGVEAVAGDTRTGVGDEATPAGETTATDAESGSAESGIELPVVQPTPPVPLPDPAVLRAEADIALDQGDAARARTALVDAARAYAAEGLYDAALDACHLALMVAPGDPDLHLELVDLYLLRGWHETAAEKLLLLDRLLALEADEASRGRLRAIVMAAFPDEPSLAALRG